MRIGLKRGLPETPASWLGRRRDDNSRKRVATKEGTPEMIRREFVRGEDITPFGLAVRRVHDSAKNAVWYWSEGQP